jgi:hypothetical protein
VSDFVQIFSETQKKNKNSNKKNGWCIPEREGFLVFALKKFKENPVEDEGR